MIRLLARLLGKATPEAPDEFGRSGKWPRVRAEHIRREPECVACGRSDELEVHHIQPYHEKPELELDSGNLITLCADPCHFVHGHAMNWQWSVPSVREDCVAYRRRLKAARMTAGK